MKDLYVIFIILLSRKVFNLKMKLKCLIIILKRRNKINRNLHYISTVSKCDILYMCTCPFSPSKLIPGVFHDPAYFYRPLTKFAKVMFLHLSVSHSVHRGNA